MQDLSKIAYETKCSFALVKHFSKRQEMANSTHNITGSVAYAGVVRAMNFIVPKKEEDGSPTDVKTMVSVKTNLGPKPQPMDFQITNDGISWEFGDEDFDFEENQKTRPPIKKEECRDAIVTILSDKFMSSSQLHKTLSEEPFEFRLKTRKSGLALAIAEKLVDWKIYPPQNHRWYSLPENPLPEEEPKGTEGTFQFGDVQI